MKRLEVADGAVLHDPRLLMAVGALTLDVPLRLCGHFCSPVHEQST
jgi:hypothetical protein